MTAAESFFYAKRAMAARHPLAGILVLALLVGLLTEEGRAAPTVPRIGYLGTTPAADPDPLAEGLRALGWVDGRITVERRYTEGDVERAPRLAAELVALDVDVIVAAAPPNVRAAQKATTSIPIVMFAVSDPVGMGFVESLARPGGNITGVTSAVPGEFFAKELQLIKESVPAAARVGLLFNAANPLNYAAARSSELVNAARALSIELRDLEIRSESDIATTMSAENLRAIDAVFVVGDPLTFRYRHRIHELAALQKIPTFVPAPEYVEDRALLGYGPSLRDALRQTATYVDRILKGARPADLPVAQPREYRLVVNLRAAKALGLRLPSSLVMRADEVIE